MGETSQWLETAEHLCEQVLESVDYRGGAVDALQLARQLGYDVIFDRHQAGRGRLKRIAGRISIFLRPDERPERVQWALCHEIGESLAHRLFLAQGVDPREENPGLRENVANLLATRLLLPRSDFFPQARLLDDDLPALKQRYRTASYELIALRLLDDPRSRCVTIVDQGRITKRRSHSQTTLSGPFLPAEATCWQDSHRLSCYQEQQSAELRIRCWPIHEPHWKREIVLTHPQETAIF